MYKRYMSTIIFALSLFTSNLSLAADKPVESQLAYFTLEPDLTTNFHTSGKKLGYVQVRIDIMVIRQQDLTIVEHHQPLVRDTVIELLGTQSEDTIKSLSGREDLRKTLVHKLNEVLLSETGKTVIADLLFTKYLYQ
ncbi:flagellar basal body-associated protein FliL [Vibrio sagamiensis]|uniref:Flagellar protein FliL n=1 Tax=Vibrio sagamiensis NBRC 104589 TaxID=1219064 RepID=A0A511QHT2_9VIBR|nr:flagellar basal body-associated protein FliL [Vibrio sagamiensis]GEM76869.1 flagellar basal body-associated protein FliL [Vibrio sagamiensis NBRC 104589]